MVRRTIEVFKPFGLSEQENAAADDAAGRIVLALREQARRRAPLRSGALRESVWAYLSGIDYYGVRIEVVADAPHAQYVIYGTRPHAIRPRNKKALWWPGARHPVRGVWHPGTSPNDFLSRAIRETDVHSAIMRAIREAVYLMEEPAAF